MIISRLKINSSNFIFHLSYFLLLFLSFKVELSALKTLDPVQKLSFKGLKAEGILQYLSSLCWLFGFYSLMLSFCI